MVFGWRRQFHIKLTNDRDKTQPGVVYVTLEHAHLIVDQKRQLKLIDRRKVKHLVMHGEPAFGFVLLIKVPDSKPSRMHAHDRFEE